MGIRINKTGERNEALPVKSEICYKCSGRGYAWRSGKIINRRTGEEVATTYREGERCQTCNGTGEIKSVDMRRVLLTAAMAAPIVYGGLWFLLSL